MSKLSEHLLFDKGQWSAIAIAVALAAVAFPPFFEIQNVGNFLLIPSIALLGFVFTALSFFFNATSRLKKDSWMYKRVFNTRLYSSLVKNVRWIIYMLFVNAALGIIFASTDIERFLIGPLQITIINSYEVTIPVHTIASVLFVCNFAFTGMLVWYAVTRYFELIADIGDPHSES